MTAPALRSRLSLIGANLPWFWTGVAGAGGLLAIVGAVLPWVRLQTADIDIAHTGIAAAGDGYITIGLGAMIAVLAARTVIQHRLPSRAFGWIAMIAGFFLLSIPALDYQAFRASLLLLAPATASLVRPEIGLYVSVVGGAMAIVGGWQSRRRPRAANT